MQSARGGGGVRSSFRPRMNPETCTVEAAEAEARNLREEVLLLRSRVQFCTKRLTDPGRILYRGRAGLVPGRGTISQLPGAAEAEAHNLREEVLDHKP